MVVPFMLHWPSLFISKVSNSRKKVLITPAISWSLNYKSINQSINPNYCITYLPRDISLDFKKCEHVNLRAEWTCVIFEELYYVANNQKIADKKKADYQEALEKSCADSAAWSRDSYMKDPEKSHADIAAGSREIYEKDLEKSC